MANDVQRFDSQAVAASLKQAFQSELEAVHRASSQPGTTKPQVYKPPTVTSTTSASSSQGAWGSSTPPAWGQSAVKQGTMSNGQDFLQSLNSSLNQVKSKQPSTTPATTTKK